MDIAAVMAEVDARLRTITGLRTTQIGVDGQIQPPAAVQYLPDRIDFDQTAGRGVDKVTDLIVVVFVRKTNARTAVQNLLPYVAGSGPKSIKAKLDSAGGAYASCSDFQVVYAEIDQNADLGGAGYLAALFHCNFAGPGA
jgi:hypothetical protein